MHRLKHFAGRPGCLASRKIVELGREVANSRCILADLQNDQAQFAKCIMNMFSAAARNELAGDVLKTAIAKQAVAIKPRKQFQSFEEGVAAIVASEALADRDEQFESFEQGVAAIVASEVFEEHLTAACNELAGDAVKPACAKQAVAIEREKQFQSFEAEVAAIVASEVLVDPQVMFKLKAFAEFVLGGVVERAELMNKFAIS
jgi:hypothetical protein